MSKIEAVTIPAMSVKRGDYIHHGIICRVTAVHPLAFAGDSEPYELSVFVEDGNGERYFFRTEGGTLASFPGMTDADWSEYRGI